MIQTAFRWTSRLVVGLVLTSLLLAACGERPAHLYPSSEEGSPSDDGGAKAQGSEAETARALACHAVRVLPENPRVGLRLAVAAAHKRPLPESAEALHRALAKTRDDEAFAAHHGSTLAAYWAPDGTRVLTTSLDMTARLWDTEGRETAVLAGHVGSIHQAVFAPDGKRVVTASVDHTARVWDLDGTCLSTLRGHEAEVLTAEFSPGGEDVLTVSLDGSARVWTADGTSARLHLDGDAVAGAWFTAGPQWRVAFWAAQFGGFAWGPRGGSTYTLGDPPFEVVAITPSPSRRHFVGLTDREDVHLFDAETTGELSLRGHEAPVVSVAFAPDEQTLATASLDFTARVWNFEGKEVAVLRGHRGPVHAVSFSADGERVLTVSADRTARVWDLLGRELASVGGEDAPVVTAAFSPNGRRLLTTPYLRGMARVWTVEGELRQVLPDDTGRTLSAAWSPDGSRVLIVDRTLTPHVFVVDEAELLARAEERLGGGVEAHGEYEDALGIEAYRPAPPAGDVPLRGAYAGTVACAPCHREAYEGWARSSHARTSYFANDADLPPEVLNGEAAVHAPGRTVFRKDGDRWIARTMGEDGEEHDYEVAMVSGHLRVRFFTTRLPDGRLQVMPAMYEIPTGTWFDYSHLIFGAPTGDFETPPTIEPGSPTFWTGPVRSWDAACSHCHMSGKTPLPPPESGSGPRILWRAYAVDCEACHGPGRRHAEAWARMEMDEPLVKLEGLDLRHRTALCTRCHQEGEVLDPPYVPGKDLYEYIDPTLVVDPERADPAGRPLELIYDGLPFATSTCAGAGGLTCSTCHAPHGSTTRSLLRRPHEDGSFCVDCHGDLVKDARAHHHHDPEGSGATCVACHMPFLTIERGHGAIADHTIGIPRLGLEADRVQPDACTWCHTGGLQAPDDAPRLGAEALGAAYARWWPGSGGWPQPWMGALAQARKGTEGAGAGLAAVIRDQAVPREVRASAAQLLRGYAEDEEEAIFEATRVPDSLVRRKAIASLAALRSERADARLREALQDPSWAVRVAAARAAMEGWQRVQTNRALLEAVVPVLAEDASKLPDDDLRWFRLGAAYDLLGDREAALRAYENKLRLDPLAHAVRRHVRNLRALLGRDADD